MRIRKATADDIPSMCVMAQEFYETTHYAGIAPLDMGSIEPLASWLIADGVLLVAEHERRVVGVVGLVIAPMPFNASVMMAHELLWWVSPSARGTGAGIALLSSVEPACAERGVAAIQMTHLPNSPEHASEAYVRAGYALSEINYTKVI